MVSMTKKALLLIPALVLGWMIPSGVANAAEPRGQTNGPIGTIQQSLDDPAAQPVDFFGSAVAMSANGKTLVVGADGNGENPASVYVYTSATGIFSEKPVAVLDDPAANPASYFGHSVAISGNTIVVGSDAGLSGGTGVAYVYVKGSSGWPATPTVTLNDPDAAAGDMFGRSVAASASAIVVGAPGTNSGQGTAYIYVPSGGVWPATPTVISPNPDPALSDVYGWSVGISGARVVVGSSGLVAIAHVGPGGFPTNLNRILFDPAGAAVGESDMFGQAVAITGTTVVVGTEAQVAYIYQRGTTAWPTSPTTTLPDPPGGFSQDNFGISVAASPTAIVVGDNDSGPNGGGQAFVYTAIDGTWLSSPTASVDDPNSGLAGNADEFGKAVAVAAGTALVGAQGTASDGGVPATGVAYLVSA